MEHYLITVEQTIKTTDPETGEVTEVNEYMTSKKTDDDENKAIKAWHTRCAELVNAIGTTHTYAECKLVNSVFGELRDDKFGQYFTPSVPNPEPES